MTSPAPQTPGGRREDTAVAVGASVAAVMGAAAAAVLALLPAAVLRVRRGVSLWRAARQLDVAAAEILRDANTRTAAVLDQARTRIVVDTTNALARMLPGQPGGPPSTGLLALPAGPTWTSLAENLHGAGLAALRDMDDVFRRAAEAATAGGSAGTQAAQTMLDQLAADGLTAYIDRRGRHWDLTAYCEMATRTAATRLALATQLGLMGPRGMDLVVVDSPSGELGCRKCAPFEGRVLSLGARFPVGSPVSVRDARGMLRSAHVTASLAQAVAAGLLHPNCRHFLLPFTDGAGSISLVGSPRGFVRHGSPLYRVVIPQEDSASYRAQQKQRALERVVRRAVAAKSVAIDPVSRVRANRRLTEARSALAQHVQTYHLTRQRYRENPAKAR